MPDPEAQNEPPTGAAEELGINPEDLSRSYVGLDARGDGQRPRFDLIIEVDGDPRRAPVPDRFVSQEPHRVDLAALAAWLGLPGDVASDLPPTASGERSQGEDDEEGGEWFVAEADDEGDPLWLGPFPGWESRVTITIPSPSPIPEDADAAWTGGAALAFQRPEVGDTNAWPDDVDGWLAAIDAIAEGWRGTLRASDVRTIYGGLDDEILELTEDGPVGDDGQPIGEEATDAVDDGRRYIPPAEDDSSWDPATGSLDPALEEAMRIRGLPGALPPPEDPQTAPPSLAAADIGEHEDLPVIPMDNRTMIVAEPDPDARGCFGRLLTKWVIAGGMAVVLLLGLLLLLLSGGDDDSGTADDSASDAPAAVDDPEETAEEILQRATQDLLDARTAEIEQTFTVTGGSGGETEIGAVGGVDFETMTAQTRIESEGTSFDAHVAPGQYAFDAGTGWVTTTPGELNDNQEAEAAGLSSFGIGEAMDPVGVVSLLEAAEDIEQTGEGQFTASVTLPVDGADAMVESVYGRPQDELEGLTIPIEVDIDDDGAIRVVVVYDFDAAMSFLDDDPQASALAGIRLRNLTRYLRPGANPAILGPDSAARDLATLLDQLR